MDGEKRESLRKQLKYPARVAWPDVQEPVHCALHDVSETGARIAVEDASLVPDNVVLLLSIWGTRRECHVAWRQGNTLGLEFTRQPPQQPAKPRPIRAARPD